GVKAPVGPVLRQQPGIEPPPVQVPLATKQQPGTIVQTTNEALAKAEQPQAAPQPPSRFPYSASDTAKSDWMKSHGVFKFDELSAEAQTNVLKNFPDLAEIPESRRADELQNYSFSKEGGEAPTRIRRQGDSLIAESIAPPSPAPAGPAPFVTS